MHSREDEIFYVLEGTYEVHCADAHGFRNIGSAPARLIFVITPSGLEDYFIAISKFGPLPPSPADLAKLAEPYGLALLPPGQ